MHTVIGLVWWHLNLPSYYFSTPWYRVWVTEIFDFLDQELISYGYSSCYCCCSFWDVLQKSPRLRHFQSDAGEIWQDCSSSKISIDWRSRNFDMTSYAPDGGRGVISCRVLPSQPVFIILADILNLKLATGPPNTVCVTTLPCRQSYCYINGVQFLAPAVYRYIVLRQLIEANCTIVYLELCLHYYMMHMKRPPDAYAAASAISWSVVHSIHVAEIFCQNILPFMRQTSYFISCPVVIAYSHFCISVFTVLTFLIAINHPRTSQGGWSIIPMSWWNHFFSGSRQIFWAGGQN